MEFKISGLRPDRIGYIFIIYEDYRAIAPFYLYLSKTVRANTFEK
ncbi:hypothetical protein ACFSKL_19415 [Belliella marina]|uniref:Uncharacterized protein n=1 Tax=Belliella marina TaxID=1644146 RepID=A0ABW4VRS9_9BACT